ncbi:site-specific DNA-methyltransferase [Desertibaculum subflavum]|uniref:site-specific DNA-methyltransferase n=1 Tax=Desertibaculum subflavum TaxID=2268458 RepID=UPI0034D16551
MAELRRNPKNARTHSPKQIEKLAASIREYGFVVPIVVDETNMILSGHGRYDAAELLGLATVPTIRVGHLTDAQKRAYSIVDNRLTELSRWEKDTLKLEFEGLIELEYDVELTGFSTAEVDLIIDGAEEVSGAVEDPAIPEPPEIAVTRPGDMWVLGPHQLLCADSTLPDSYACLLQGEKAEMVFTDPPYNVPIQGFVGGSGRHKHREFAMASGEMTGGQFRGFLSSVFQLLARHTKPASIHFVCTDWRHLQDMQAAGDSTYSALKNICVWTKTNAGMGSFYRSQHEMVLVFQSGRGRPINNFGLGESGRYRTNVWSYAGANTFRRGRNSDLADHPTVKPLSLVADAIRDCSRRNGLVLDPFGGSGTTILAAERTGRIARVIELDASYCDVAIRRWQERTGKTARLAGSDASFADVAQSRLAER